MERDGMDEKEARELFSLTKAEINDALTDGDGPVMTLIRVEDIVADNLGLEPDYVEDFIF